MAFFYSGSCRSLTKYAETISVSGGSVTGFVKAITAVYLGVDQVRKNASGSFCNARVVINVPLTNPADVDIADLIPYDDLTEDWAQTKIDDYLPNVKEWLNKEIAKQYDGVETSDPPWQGA